MSEEIKSRKIPVPQIERWKREGVELCYARFHQPVPPAKDMEPVSEFKKDMNPSTELYGIRSSKDKYLVDSLTYTDKGLIYRVRGEVNIVPLANVIYGRTIV